MAKERRIDRLPAAEARGAMALNMMRFGFFFMEESAWMLVLSTARTLSTFDDVAAVEYVGSFQERRRTPARVPINPKISEICQRPSNHQTTHKTMKILAAAAPPVNNNYRLAHGNDSATPLIWNHKPVSPSFISVQQ